MGIKTFFSVFLLVVTTQVFGTISSATQLLPPVDRSDLVLYVSPPVLISNGCYRLNFQIQNNADQQNNDYQAVSFNISGANVYADASCGVNAPNSWNSTSKALRVYVRAQNGSSALQVQASLGTQTKKVQQKFR